MKNHRLEIEAGSGEGAERPMLVGITDAEVEAFRHLPKRVDNPGARWILKPAHRPRHRQRTFRATGVGGDGAQYRFLVYQRQHLRDPDSYSCGIIYSPPRAPKVALARYNGSSHEHDGISFEPHSHRATEAAVIAGRKVDHAAEPTDRYNTVGGALACLVRDFNLSGIPEKPQPTSQSDADES